MRRIWQFVKTTVLGGAIFLLPIAATLVIIVKAGKMAVDAATPLAEKLPLSKGEAVLAVYVVGAIARVLVSFTAGLFARSVSMKGKTVSFLEDRVLNRLPPYVAIRKQTDHLAGIKADENLKPVPVRVHTVGRSGSSSMHLLTAMLPFSSPARRIHRLERCKLLAQTISPRLTYLTGMSSPAWSSPDVAFQTLWESHF